jgi:hypothetical protein
MAPTRSSLRLAAKPSSVPVAQCAQHKLMRELNFINPQIPAQDAVVTAYIHYKKYVAFLYSITS